MMNPVATKTNLQLLPGKKYFYISILLIIVYCPFRLEWIEGMELRFERYAHSYMQQVEKEGFLNVSRVDEKVIIKKILPNKGRTFCNFIQWTEKQISSDDELLLICKTVWENEKRRKNTEDEIMIRMAQQTFDERQQEWKKKVKP